MHPNDRLTSTACFIVAAGIVINRLFGIAVITGLAVSLFAPGLFARLMTASAAQITGLRLTLLIGVAMAVAIDRLLAALGAVIASAGQGEPFSPANAGRLRAAGWALLALQLLDIPGALVSHFFPELGTAAPGGDVSVGGWFAVLMLFVLSRAFAAGAVMRGDLEGTI